MISAILFVLLVAAGARTKPTKDTLRPHLRSQDDESSDGLAAKLTSFLTRVAAPEPKVRLVDCFVFVAALAEDGRAWIGAFNAWLSVRPDFVAPLFANSGGGSVGAQMQHEDEAEHLFQAAVQKKAQRDYSESARLFARSASAFQAAGSDTALMEAAKAFTEAAKCYSVLKQTAYAKKANCDAAVLYERMDTNGWTRAAQLYEKVGQDEKDSGDLLSALSYYDKALELYRNCQDGRTYQIDVIRAQILSLLGRHSTAIPLYESLSAHAIQIPTLKFSIRDHLTSALFSYLALLDQSGLAHALERYSNDYPLFSDVEPVWRMLVQAWSVGDEEVFESVEAKFRILNGVQKGSWQERALLGVKESLHSLC